MEKVDITLAFDQEKLNALEFYLKKEKTTAQRRLEESLAQLYEQAVPEPVREYLDARSSAARPKRPPRPSQPKAAAPKPAADSTKQEKEGSV